MIVLFKKLMPTLLEVCGGRSHVTIISPRPRLLRHSSTIGPTISEVECRVRNLRLDLDNILDLRFWIQNCPLPLVPIVTEFHTGLHESQFRTLHTNWPNCLYYFLLSENV